MVLDNLVDNAIKFTEPGGHVSVTFSRERDAVTVEVADDGCGIAPRDHERVFERFYRIGGDCHSSNEQGSGLGLSIVKLIVDLYQAKIYFKESSFESGLALVIVFPTLTEQRRLVP